MLNILLNSLKNIEFCLVASESITSEGAILDISFNILVFTSTPPILDIKNSPVDTSQNDIAHSFLSI